MPIRHVTTALLVILFASGCAVTPRSYEDSLLMDRATRNDVRNWEKEMRYRVTFQYANAARVQHENPLIQIPSDMTMGFQVPFGIWDYSMGNNLGAAVSFIDWFNSGLSEDARYNYYYNQTLARVSHPNTLYFAFDERPGVATPEDIHALWDEAYALFQSVRNAHGECMVAGFTEELQYRNTFPKDVPGLYKEIGYTCPNPLFPDQAHMVVVSAWANPFDGVRAFAAVESASCYIQAERGVDFVDTRGCGMKLANRQRASIPDSGVKWMELVVTPVPESPELFHVVSSYRGDTTILPGVEKTPEFIEFLRGLEYSEEP